MSNRKEGENMKEINIKIENEKKRKKKQAYRKCNVKTDRMKKMEKIRTKEREENKRR